MNTNEQTSNQEWTAEWFETTFQDHDWIKQVCDAHNAALAAEREKVKPLVEGIHMLYALVDATCIEQAQRARDAALAKVKEEGMAQP